MSLHVFLRRFIAGCQDFYQQDKELLLLVILWVVLLIPVLIKLAAR